LEDYCSVINVLPLSRFFGFGGRASGDWFTPEDGLATIAGLIQHVRSPENKIKNKKALLGDLQTFARVLEHERGVGAKFHVEIDV
jgi:hypothetical protein